LLLDEDGLCGHGTDTARTHNSSESGNDMDERKEEIAHGSIVAGGIAPQIGNPPVVRQNLGLREERLHLPGRRPFGWAVSSGLLKTPPKARAGRWHFATSRGSNCVVRVRCRRLEAKIERGKITLTPKTVIDRGIAESLEEFRKGRSYGPFDTSEQILASLHQNVKKQAGRKGRKPRR